MYKLNKEMCIQEHPKKSNSCHHRFKIQQKEGAARNQIMALLLK